MSIINFFKCSLNTDISYNKCDDGSNSAVTDTMKVTANIIIATPVDNPELSDASSPACGTMKYVVKYT